MNEHLIDQITDEVYRLLKAGPLHERTRVCGDCTGSCVTRCAFKIPDFIDAGADRIGGTLGMGRVQRDAAQLIDHTLLKPDASRRMIETLCDEAAQFNFMSVCVNPTWVRTAADRLSGTGVATCTVIGFPLGACRSDVKAFEARRAQEDGATELDMVINVGRLKSGEHTYVQDDIAAVVGARREGSLVKVIIETCLLNDQEKRDACRLAKAAGADFVKTSTGFAGGGATAADIALMRETVGPGLGVKASGGVSNFEDLRTMVKAGATRIGASAGVRIVQEVA